MGQVVRPRHHLEVFLGIERRAGLEQRNVQAAFGENFGRHAAACARPNDAYIIGLRRTDDLRHFAAPYLRSEDFHSRIRQMPYSNLRHHAPSSSLRTFSKTQGVRPAPVRRFRFLLLLCLPGRTFNSTSDANLDRMVRATRHFDGYISFRLGDDRKIIFLCQCIIECSLQDRVAVV